MRKMRYDRENTKEGKKWANIFTITNIPICIPIAFPTPTGISTKTRRQLVKRMVEEGYDCSEVLVQLAAVRSALDNTGKVILKDHMRHCMVDAVAAGDEDAIDDLCQAIDKFMK